MKITAQAAGAFGEKAVEAELLRRNWMPANVNASIKNAADFDIYASKRFRKKYRTVHIRVKTCRPESSAFLCGGFRPGEIITSKGIGKEDFTVVVRMGDGRDNDRFYVVPTIVVRKEIAKRQAEHRPRGNKDIGMWRLSFGERKDRQERAGHGIDRKWSKYLGSWELLDG